MNPHPLRVRPAISWPGGIAVLLAKTRSNVEVINDINGDLISFYRCVRFHQDALLTELEFILNSREEFKDFCSQPGLTDIQRASRWFYRNKNCFGGVDLRSFGTSATSTGGSRAARMESIRALSHRLDRVCIEHLTWQRSIDIYDRSTTFFFIDPPYTECGRTAYDGWTTTDVQTLRDRLLTVRGQWLLTINDTPSNRQIFADCSILPVIRAKGINGKAADPYYRELVITPLRPLQEEEPRQPPASLVSAGLH